MKLKPNFTRLFHFHLCEHKIRWKRVLLIYLIFIPLMLFLEFCLHLFPVELYEFKTASFEDIDLTDIYYTTERFTKNTHKKEDILLINIGDIERADLRKEMPKIIDKLNQYKAKKIGIDVRFDGKKDPEIDSVLISCLMKNQNKVVIGKYHQDVIFGDTTKQFNQRLDSIIGLVELPQGENRTVRKYWNRVSFEKDDNHNNKKHDTYLSFANRLVEDSATAIKDSIFFLKYATTFKGYYDAFNPNLNQDSIAVDFPAIESSQLLNDGQYENDLKALIENKIIIIGQLARDSMKFNPDDVEDKFRVPNNSDLVFRDKTMPGMVVHANAVQMLLDFKEDDFDNFEHGGLEAIIIAFLFLFYILFVLTEKIEPFLIRLPIEIGILVPMVIFLIGFSIWLMGCNIHLKLDKLLFYIPILIEFKMFLHELYFDFEPHKKHCINKQKQTLKIKIKMNKKYYLIVCFFLLSISSFSQEINMVVYKGDVKISHLPAYHRVIYKITDTTTVACPKDYRVLFYTKAKAYMLKSQTPYSFAAVLKGLNNSTQTFVKFMDSNHTIAKANKTVVSGIAAGIRGLNGKKGGKLRDQEQYAIPIDSAKLVKNTVVLEWKLGKNNTSGHLKITNAATEEVIVDKTVEGTGTLILKLENDGWYDWELTSVLDNKTIASNSFVKLSAIQTKNELAALDEFKKSLINFDEESKSLFIDDYLEQHLLELN